MKRSLKLCASLALAALVPATSFAANGVATKAPGVSMTSSPGVTMGQSTAMSVNSSSQSTGSSGNGNGSGSGSTGSGNSRGPIIIINPGYGYGYGLGYYGGYPFGNSQNSDYGYGYGYPQRFNPLDQTLTRNLPTDAELRASNQNNGGITIPKPMAPDVNVMVDNAPEVRAAEISLRAAQADLDGVRNATISRLADDARYKEAVARLHAAQEERDLLKAQNPHQSAEAAIEAAQRVLAASNFVRQIESAALAGDPQVSQSRAKLQDAINQRVLARDHARTTITANLAANAER